MSAGCNDISMFNPITLHLFSSVFRKKILFGNAIAGVSLQFDNNSKFRAARNFKA